jgi:copper resistance protein D
VSSVPDVLSVVCRAFAFVLLLQSGGIALFLAAFGRRLPGSQGTIQSLGWISALAAMAFVGGHYMLEGARMAGDMSGVIDPSLQRLALHSPTGEALGLQVPGLVLVAVGLRTGRPVLGSAGAILAVISFAVVGHTSVSPQRAVLAPLLILHLLVVAFWIGALGSLYLASMRETAGVAAGAVAAFSAVAIWLVPCVFLAGLGMTLLLVPGLSVLLQPYGELLLVKTTLYAVLLGLAALNKWRFGPRMATEPSAAEGFRHAVAIEYVLVCSVLTVTAVMTMFYSPEAA